MQKTQVRDPDELLTVEEVARIVKASVSTVRKWIRTGELRSVKVGRLRRVRRADLQSFQEEPEEYDEEYWDRRFPVFTADAPILKLAGKWSSGLTDVSEHHDKYAYRKDWEDR